MPNQIPENQNNYTGIKQKIEINLQIHSNTTKFLFSYIQSNISAQSVKKGSECSCQKQLHTSLLRVCWCCLEMLALAHKPPKMGISCRSQSLSVVTRGHRIYPTKFRYSAPYQPQNTVYCKRHAFPESLK